MGPINAVIFPDKVNIPKPNPCVLSGVRLAMTTLLELCRGPEKKVPIIAKLMNCRGVWLIEIPTTTKIKNRRLYMIIFLSFLKKIPYK